MRKETQKAIVQIPKELNRLSRIIAAIGETLFDKKLEKIRRDEKKFLELMEKEQSRRGIT